MKTLPALTLMASALAVVTSSAQAQTTLRLSTYVNKVDIRYEGFEKFAELVAEKTDGEVNVEIFPSSTLHGWSEGVDAVTGGIADIAWIPADNRLPCYRVTSLYPALVDLERQHELDAAYTDIVRDEAAEAGLVPVFNSNYSYDQEWWFQESISDITQLDGQLVRSIGPLVSLMITSWGGEPVFVSPNEVFQSAERGVVDGINMGVATYSSWQLWDVMPYMVNASLFYGNIQYMMNKRKFDDLDGASQQALLDAAREAEAWLKPRYEGWVNERVGQAVMQGGGAAVSLNEEASADIVASIAGEWEPTVAESCGPERADAIKALFADYRR
ncbi:TRAP transporter substrate-binding protein DctP [Halomonas sp. DP5Y7-2]|uniref:TRAP transporter substrate-binding protein DctP n=1 Tax=Halomonas sp. DP5Y7-2 TaxID=2859076 RepID=UPI001C997006|nr:TRAP transporter substrate-binding protein DctP [Halomonas sp. DP5Y7-2]MBY5985891.1 TRAP transporter substrate-binding protein DctP [Halomonas sp. DP5Y7-2]